MLLILIASALAADLNKFSNKYKMNGNLNFKHLNYYLKEIWKIFIGIIK